MWRHTLAHTLRICDPVKLFSFCCLLLLMMTIYASVKFARYARRYACLASWIDSTNIRVNLPSSSSDDRVSEPQREAKLVNVVDVLERTEWGGPHSLQPTTVRLQCGSEEINI